MVGNRVTALFEAQGHLLDSGLLTEALDAMLAAGAEYEIRKLEVGTTSDQESSVHVAVHMPDQSTYERVCEDLMSLGFSESAAEPVKLKPVTQDGVAPEGFYSTTNLTTRVRIGGTWVAVGNQRMDSVVVVTDETARCVAIRDLRIGGAVGRYQFTHALIQETLAGELSTSRKVRLHARIAQAMEELYSSKLAD